MIASSQALRPTGIRIIIKKKPFSIVMSAKTDACVLIKTGSSGYMGHPHNEA